MTRPKSEARNRIRIGISLRNAQNICLFSSSRRLSVFIFHFFQLIIQRVHFEQHTNGVFGTVRNEAYRRYYRYRTIRYVRYDINTGTGQFGKFGTASIPAPNTLVSSVRHQCRYRTLRQVRYDINTGTGHLGKFGTTSVPVPRIPVPYRTHP